MAALKPKVREDLVVVEIDGEAVLYDPAEVLLHHLNPTAAVVLRLCDGSGTVRELSEDIADVLGMSTDKVLRQVRQVVSQFKQEGLLDGHPREPVHHVHRHEHTKKMEERSRG
ncbi:MAG TPA: PqqD family protein [Actinomycetota bacterium]